MQFPAMRRLSIATAHAFLFVYATTSAPSFDSIKSCFEEVREQREDYQEIPFVVAGNKLDLASTHREVTIEDVSEWVYCELPKLRWAQNSGFMSVPNRNLSLLWRMFHIALNAPKDKMQITQQCFSLLLPCAVYNGQNTYKQNLAFKFPKLWLI